MFCQIDQTNLSEFKILFLFVCYYTVVNLLVLEKSFQSEIKRFKPISEVENNCFQSGYYHFKFFAFVACISDIHKSF